MNVLQLTVVMIGLFLARPLWAAEDLVFSNLHSAITVNTDASISVTETITAEFGTPHHGIYRTIPFAFTTTNGEQAAIPIAITGVTQDGQAGTYTTTLDAVNIRVKIGDADRTLTGRHTYTVTYTAQAAANFFTDHDELYWNVSGDQWDAPLRHVSATVTLPAGVNDTADVITTCYTGEFGSTAQQCTQSHTLSTAEFAANDFLTVVVGWPTGLVTKPDNFDELRQAGTVQPPMNVRGLLITASSLFAVLVGIAGLLIWRWNRTRDRRPIIPQYEPPVEMRPAEAATLIGADGGAMVIGATVVDLAVRGYLRIEEQDSTAFLGLGHTKTYEFVERRTADDALRPFERQVLDALFRQEAYPATNGRIALATFRQHRRQTYQAFAPINGFVDDSIIAHGWKERLPGWKGLLGPVLSTSGRDAAWQLRGFRLFLKTAERYRVQWQERKNIFEQYLPYAMVFGVAKKWTEVLGPTLTTPPDWYNGDFSHGFSAALLYTSLNSMTSQMVQSGVSGAASGSSGFSGGSSGGGGGGGGGGGW